MGEEPIEYVLAGLKWEMIQIQLADLAELWKVLMLKSGMQAVSADNWAECPNCKAGNVDEVLRLEDALRQAYGKVSLEDYQKIQAQLTIAREDDDHLRADGRRNFREDYEIYGAEDGVIKLNYSGSCTKCGLRVSFDFEKPFWPESE